MSAVLELPGNAGFVLAGTVTGIAPRQGFNELIVWQGDSYTHIPFDDAGAMAVALRELVAAWRVGLGEPAEPAPLDAEWQHKMRHLADALGWDPNHHPSNLIGGAIEAIENAGDPS